MGQGSRILVRWTDPGRAVVIKTPRGGRIPMRLEDFQTNPPVTPQTTVHVRHRDGPGLISLVAGFAAAGRVAGVVVRSPVQWGRWDVVSAHRTPLIGTAAQTLRVWATRDEASVAAHPAGAVRRYAPRGSVQAVATLIGRTFDPLWFTVAHSPDRWARLESAWGLVPYLDYRPQARRLVVVAAWGGPGTAPADFFGRRHADLLADGCPPPVAERRVGRLFLRALVAAWLDRRDRGDPLFDPPKLFDQAACAAVGPLR